MTLPLGVSRIGGGSPGADDGWLGAALHPSPVAFVLFDSDLRIQYANEAYARLNERPVADHIGRKPHEVLSRRSGEAIEQIVRQAGRALDLGGHRNALVQHEGGVEDRDDRE